MLKTLLSLALLAASVTALANDTPTVDQPSVADRMASARSAIYLGNWKEAQGELKVAVREEPKNADAHNLLAFSYRKQANPDLPKAFEHYGIALKLNPQHKGAHEYIGEAYLMDKRPAEAEKHLTELEKLCGNKTCVEYTDLAKALAAYKAKAR